MNRSKSRLILLIVILVLTIPALLQAQYKREVPNIPGLTMKSASGATSILGIDIAKIDFQNSYSMQVSSFGGNTVAMGLLKSSFNYAINPQVSFQGYVGLVHSPFSNFSPMDDQYSFSNGLNKDNILFGGEVTYRPSENMFLRIGFNRAPMASQNQFYSPNNYQMFGY